MARCPACGIRLTPDAACPRHGLTGAPAELGVPGEAPPQVPGLGPLAPIGHGGFGRVYRAERLADGRPVAVKVAHARTATARLRLAREAAALAMVGPQRAPAVFGEQILADGRPALIMELVEAPTLAERMAHGQLTLADAVALLGRVVEAVAVAHARGVVHRDLKPENVLVGEAGGARLVDFGLARRDEDTAAPPAARERLAGTAAYMAPEQVVGEPVEATADVYALGVIGYELLTGRLPFWGAPAEIQQAHRFRRPPLLEGVPPAIATVVLVCLAKAPADRYRDAGALRAALARAVEGDVPGAPDDPSAAPRTAASRGGDDPAAGAGGRDERRGVAVVCFAADRGAPKPAEEVVRVGASSPPSSVACTPRELDGTRPGRDRRARAARPRRGARRRADGCGATGGSWPRSPS